MVERERQPDVERRIHEHLEAVDRAMIAKGVPLTERRSVTGDVEAQIRDMLAETSQAIPTLADAEAVLRKLDAPESYAGEAEPALMHSAAPAPVEREFWAFRKRLLLFGLICCVLGLPVGIAINRPYVWGLSIIGIIVASMKLRLPRWQP